MKRSKPYLIGGLVTAVLIFAAFSTYNVMAATGCFSDTNGHWAETFICFASEYGIVGGYPDGTFKPEARVTRAEAAVMFQNTVKVFRAEGHTWGTNTGMVVALPSSIAAGANQVYDTFTITTPSDGALVVNGFAYLQCNGGFIISCDSTSGNVYLQVDGNRYGRSRFMLDGIAGQNDSSENVSLSSIFSVGPGTHTVEIVVYNTGGNTMTVHSSGVNAIFIPYDGAGAIAVSSGD